MSAEPRCPLCRRRTCRAGTEHDWDDVCVGCHAARRTTTTGPEEPGTRLVVWRKGTWLLPPEGTLVVGCGGRETR